MSPLDRLARRVLARWCATRTMERLVDAVLADTEHERQEMLAVGRPWRARLVALSGTMALCRAVAAHAAHALASWEPEPSRRTRQAVWIGAALSVVSTLLLATLPYLGMFAHHRGNPAWLLLYLLPSALPVGLTVGVVAAACWTGDAPRDSAAARRRRIWGASLACSILAIVMSSWVTPLANQQVRESLFPNRLLLPRGVAELTLPEIGRLAYDGRRPPDLMPHETPGTAMLALHGRAALALGPLLLTFMACELGPRRRGAPARLCGGLVVLALYVTWWFGVASAPAPERHYLLAAWTPATLALTTGLLARRTWRLAPR